MKELFNESTKNFRENRSLLLRLAFVLSFGSMLIRVFVGQYNLILFILIGYFTTIIPAIASFQVIKGNERRVADYFAWNRSFKLIKTHLLYFIRVILWSLLFVIPGIIKALEYSQALYLIQDFPEYDSKEAIKVSSSLMSGRKWEICKLLILSGLLSIVLNKSIESIFSLILFRGGLYFANILIAEFLKSFIGMLPIIYLSLVYGNYYKKLVYGSCK